MSGIIFEAFVLGLSTGPVCLAYCSPVLIPFITSINKSGYTYSLRLILLFLTGRLGGYLITGIFAGLIGIAISGYLNKSFLGIISIIIGIALITFGFISNFPGIKICKPLNGKNTQNIFILLLGLFTGLNFCPPFIAAIFGAAESGTFFSSIFYFLFFFIGTTFYFPLMLIFSYFSKIELVRNVAKITLIISGCWFFLKGIMDVIV